MWNSYLDWLEFHVGFENSCLVISLVFPNAEKRLCNLVRSELPSDCWWGIISLIELPFVFCLPIPWPFWNRPLRFVLSFTRVWTFFRMISAWANNLWCRIQQNKRIKTFDSPSGIQTILWLIWYFRSKIRIVLWSWSHFVLLFRNRELNIF